MANLRWKLVTVFAVLIAFATVGVYPILANRHGWGPKVVTDKALKLGLDLKGGVNLVLRVETDTALALETQQETERFREELRTRKIDVKSLTNPDATHVRVEGVAPAQDAAFRQAATELQANFDRGAGVAGTYTFTMKPNIAVQLAQDAVVQARETIDRRVNELGVTEPSIAQQGKDRKSVV